MESKPRDLFAASDTSKAHVGSDVDESFDALHHTVGHGATQAAAGNHKHPEYVLTGSIPGAITDHGALTGLGDDDHPQYVHSGPAGDSMDGHLQINNSKGLTIHSPGNAVVSLGSQLNSGTYELEVLASWDGDTGPFAPVHCADPLMGFHAATADWVDGNFAYSGHGHTGVSVSGSAVFVTNGAGEGTFSVGSGYIGAPVICNGDFPAHQRAASIKSWSNGGTITITNTDPNKNLRVNWIVTVA